MYVYLLNECVWLVGWLVDNSSEMTQQMNVAHIFLVGVIVLWLLLFDKTKILQFLHPNNIQQSYKQANIMNNNNNNNKKTSRFNTMNKKKKFFGSISTIAPERKMIMIRAIYFAFCECFQTYFFFFGQHPSATSEQRTKKNQRKKTLSSIIL